MALFEAGTQHQLVHRAVKYGILFIGLTILAFIVLDLGLRARLHPVQYELVGWPRWCSISLCFRWPSMWLSAQPARPLRPAPF